MDLLRRLRPDVLSTQELTPGMVEELDAAGLKELLPYRVLEAEWSARRQRPVRQVSADSAGGPVPGDRAQHARRHDGPSRRQADRVRRRASLPAAGQPGVRVDGGPGRLPPASPDTIRILAGDFNASLDHAAMRRFLSRGYADAADSAGQGLIPTWPANKRLPPLITIDHVRGGPAGGRERGQRPHRPGHRPPRRLRRPAPALVLTRPAGPPASPRDCAAREQASRSRPGVGPERAVSRAGSSHVSGPQVTPTAAPGCCPSPRGRGPAGGCRRGRAGGASPARWRPSGCRAPRRGAS